MAKWKQIETEPKDETRMEKILKIKEDDFKDDSNGYWYSGYLIETNKQTIKLGIDNSQSCCENWGYLLSEDNFEEFLGAELLDIKMVDKALKAEKVQDFYEGNVMFVTLETSKGPLQFVAYNDHNGYYGHDAVVISKQLNHSEIL